MKKKSISMRIMAILLSGAMILAMAACGSDPAAGEDSNADVSAQQEADKTQTENTTDGAAGEESANADVTTADAPQIEGLTCESVMPLTYATQFQVFYYNDGYKLLEISDGTRYLIVPEGKEAPDALDENVVVLQQPLDRIYLAATAAMSLFDSLDALDHIRLSGTSSSGWYIENAVTAMENGDILFAGKYDEPDYELMIDEDCDLAIESTMILHSPKVKEMIEDLDIPVLIDYSSYESHPLGRTEWIRFYGAMLNKEDEADAFFGDQAKIIEELKGFENTEKTVAFFYVSTDGTVVVRETTDYIATMIEIAGGRYIFDSPIDPDSSRTSVSLSMEEFYDAAVNADYLIYNSSIDSELKSVDELMAKSELFADFKAVKEDNVWVTGKYMYQATDIVGNMISDFHHMLTDGDDSGMTFLYRIH